MESNQFIQKRKKFSSLLFEIALPNEYLVVVGKKTIKPVLGGKMFRPFKKFLHIPAYVQKLQFQTDNANVDYQGIGIEGYATWRINPQNPELAISTLDFFDENDPMNKTNNDLRTICIEAVRHVIANMSIEDALKNKDAIANNLKIQLTEIEKKWGIVFDQVGIERVRIMSDKLFNDLQSQFRNKLRLEAAKTQIATEREIFKEQNTIQEKNEVEKLMSLQKVEIARSEKDHLLKKMQMEEQQRVNDIQQQNNEQQFRRDIEFSKEKQNKNNEVKLLQLELQIGQSEIEKKILFSEDEIVQIKNQIELKKLELERIAREIHQTYSQQELANKLIEELPLIFERINIQNYSVMQTSGNEGISPVTKILNEILAVLQHAGVKIGQ